MKKIFILSLFSLLLFSGCNDLDIAPKNLITDKDLIGSESGMDIYMARMYSNMPFEDFKYTLDLHPRITDKIERINL